MQGIETTLIARSVENSLNAFGLVNEKGLLDYVNKAFIVMWGYDNLEDIRGTLFNRYLEDKKSAEEILRDAKRLGSTIREVKAVRENGTEFHILLSVLAEYTTDGSAYFSVSAIDISDRNNTLLKLKESESLFRTSFEESAIGMAIINPEGNFIRVNAAVCKTLGYTAEEMKARTFLDITYPEDRERSEKEFRKGTKFKKHYTIEKRYLTKDGEIVHGLASVSPIYNDDGLLRYSLAQLQDITALRKSHQELETSEARYKDLVEKSGVAIVVDNRDGDIIYFNEDFARLFGYTTAEMRRKKRWGLIHPDSIQTVTNYHERRMVGEYAPGIFSLKGLKKSGEAFWMEVRTSVLYKDGEPSGTRNYLWDISSRMQSVEHLQHKNREIAQMTTRAEDIKEEEQRKLANDLHDDLGQLLTALKMDLTWLAKKLGTSDQEIFKRLSSAQEITDESMDWIKRTAMELRPTALDNLGLLAALEAQASKFSSRSGIDTELNFPEKELTFPREFSTSVFRMVQEAMTNCARHSEASKLKLSIEINHDELHLTIEDNGKGMSKEQVESSGSLGLISIRERVLRWNGMFRIDSEKGSGTILEIRLPTDPETINEKNKAHRK